MAATTDSQKQLLSLIRDFASQKSQGERRVLNLEKRIDELRSDLETANAELENAKRIKETAEQELKGYEVELSMSFTSIQTLEMRIASTQDEVSKVKSDIDDLKNQEAALRDEFIHQMFGLKTKIRKFQEASIPSLEQRSCLRASSGPSEDDQMGSEDVHITDLEKRLSVIVAQTATEEQEFEKQQNLHNQLQQELAESKRRVELVEAIMNSLQVLQEATRLTTAMEEKCASFGEELQSRSICPSCHFDNSEALAEFFEEMEHH